MAEAAEILGVTAEAVRGRLKWGTLEAEDETIRLLQEQLQAERQAHAESRRLLAAALERLPPQLGPPRDEREAPTEATQEPEGAESLSSTPGPQEQISRPWWRRMFGG